MLYIIIAILIILLVILGFLYYRLTKKYQELNQRTKLRESIVDNKVIQLSNIEDTMEHNKALLISERTKIDQQLAEMEEKSEEDTLDSDSSKKPIILMPNKNFKITADELD